MILKDAIVEEAKTDTAQIEEQQIDLEDAIRAVAPMAPMTVAEFNAVPSSLAGDMTVRQTPFTLLPNTRLIAIADIAVESRKRLVDVNWAAALAQDFSTIGQIQPITLRPNSEGDGYILVAGAHRLEAATLLGWESITATIRDMDAVEAAIIEIDENLIRNELTALDQALSLAERKGLWEQKYPETAHGKNKKTNKNQQDKRDVNITSLPQGFTKEAAKATGMSASAIQKAVKLAADLTPDLIATLRSSSISDNAAQLKAFVNSEIPEEDKLNAAKAIAEGKAKNFKNALVAIGRATAVEKDTQAAYYKQVFDGWLRLNARKRREFLEAIGVSENSDEASEAA